MGEALSEVTQRWWSHCRAQRLVRWGRLCCGGVVAEKICTNISVCTCSSYGILVCCEPGGSDASVQRKTLNPACDWPTELTRLQWHTSFFIY